MSFNDFPRNSKQTSKGTEKTQNVNDDVIDVIDSYKMDYSLFLLLVLLSVSFLSSLSSLLLSLLLLLSSSLLLSLLLLLLLLLHYLLLACTSLRIFYLPKVYRKVQKKLNNSYIVSFYMETIVLKALLPVISLT